MWYNIFMKTKKKEEVKEEKSANEEKVAAVGVNHPDYDPSLPMNKQRHLA